MLNLEQLSLKRLRGFDMMVWKDTLSGVEWTYCCMIVPILIVVIMIS